ncbi:hypothetical protein D3C77_332350 [compost metagenome]
MKEHLDSPSTPDGVVMGNGNSASVSADSALDIAPPNEKFSVGESVVSKISKEIGTGEAAKDSFVYLTIRWSFLVGALTSFAIFAKSFWECSSADSVEMVKTVWSVFMPIITLALGYAFGKGR